MLKSKHFPTEADMVKWANGKNGPEYIISIVKDHTNGDWIVFYIEE